MDLPSIPNKPNLVLPFKRKRPEEDTSPSERPTAPHPPQDLSSNSEPICNECSKVDWESVPFLAARGLLDQSNQPLRPIKESPEQLAASSCRVCRILSAIGPSSPGLRHCVVYALPLSRQWTPSASGIPGSHGITVLNVGVPETGGWPASQSKCLVATTCNGDNESRLILPNSINYDRLKCLARACEERHGSFCTAVSPDHVSGLRVIDVTSRMVVEAPENCRYIALSYVWGRQTDLIAGDALLCAPPLIEDAIAVTIALGYKYLWVDRYCIPQDKPEDKHHMISQMGQVYANAYMTIIAAAGEDVQMGLPGVSIFPRQRQQVDVHNTTLLQLPCGEDDLISSKWASRGWTYQEGYFSKRRIIFTPNQVLFLCNNEYLEEYVYLLLQDQGGPPHRWLGKMTNIFPTFRPPGISYPASILLRQVEQYSLRELSYSSDSLNAIYGVLNYYTTAIPNELYPIIHLGWGLLAEQVSSGYCFCAHLDWYHQTPAKRRHEFPSWAWTGGGGPLTFGQGILVYRKDVKSSFGLPHLSWEVSMEAEGEKAVDMCAFASVCLAVARVASGGRHSRSFEPSPRRLLITCRVLPIHFRKVELTEALRSQCTKIEFEETGKIVTIDQPAFGNKSLAVLEVWDGIYVGAPLDLDRDLKQEDGVLGLIFLSPDSIHRSRTQIGCLVARHVEKGFYERVGLIRDISSFLLDGIRSQMIFLDKLGNSLELIKVTEKMREQLFEDVSERRTICLT